MKEAEKKLEKLIDKILQEVRAELTKARHKGPPHIGEIFIELSGKSYSWITLGGLQENTIPSIVSLRISEPVKNTLDNLLVRHEGVTVRLFTETEVLSKSLNISFEWKPNGPWAHRSTD